VQPAHAPAPAASASGLPANAGWARRAAVAQQPPAETAAAGGPSGSIWNERPAAIAAAAGFDAADLAGAQGLPHYSSETTWPAPGSASQADSSAGAWGPGPGSTSSYSSSATGPAGRVSSSGEYGSSTSSRAPGANLGVAALRSLGTPSKPRTAVSTGPGAAIERGGSGSSSGPPAQQPGGYVSGPGARGGDFGGGRGRAIGAGRGRMDSAEWDPRAIGGRGPAAGRGRGPGRG
jgi:hypothetical protein